MITALQRAQQLALRRVPLLIYGETGVGKSRILDAFREQLNAQGAHILRFQCSPYHANSAFYPFIDHLERALKFGREEPAQSRLDKLEAMLVDQYARPREDMRFLAAMLSIATESNIGAPALTPQRFKDETLRAIVDLTKAVARKQAAVMLPPARPPMFAMSAKLLFNCS